MLSYKLWNFEASNIRVKSLIYCNFKRHIHSFHQSIDYGPCDVTYGQHNIGTLKLHYLNYLNKVYNFLLHASLPVHQLPSKRSFTFLPFPPHTQSLPARFILGKVLPFSAKCWLIEDQTSGGRYLWAKYVWRPDVNLPAQNWHWKALWSFPYSFQEQNSLLFCPVDFLCYLVTVKGSLHLLFVEFLHSFHISIKPYVS